MKYVLLTLTLAACAAKPSSDLPEASVGIAAPGQSKADAGTDAGHGAGQRGKDAAKPRKEEGMALVAEPEPEVLELELDESLPEQVRRGHAILRNGLDTGALGCAYEQLASLPSGELRSWLQYMDRQDRGKRGADGSVRTAWSDMATAMARLNPEHAKIAIEFLYWMIDDTSQVNKWEINSLAGRVVRAMATEDPIPGPKGGYLYRLEPALVNQRLDALFYLQDIDGKPYRDLIRATTVAFLDLDLLTENHRDYIEQVKAWQPRRKGEPGVSIPGIDPPAPNDSGPPTQAELDSLGTRPAPGPDSQCPVVES